MAQLDAILSQGGQPVEELVKFENPRFGKERLHLPGPDWTNRIWQQSDRNPQVLRSLGQLYGTGRLANTGYLSILPVDQGIEHSAGASFPANPIYFDPENIIKLAIEANSNAVSSTLGVLGIVSRKYAHRIPFLVKLNHNELLSYPNQHDQTLYGSVKQAWVLWRSEQLSTLAALIRVANFGKSRKCSQQHMSLVWQLCFGATCATPASPRTE